MQALETPLIANRQTRQLSALGFKQMYRIIDKACEANNTDRRHVNGKPIARQVKTLVKALIFDHNVTKQQLSDFQKAIKVVNNVLQLPSIGTFTY